MNEGLRELQKTIEEDLTFSCTDEAGDQWKTALTMRINELIQFDFPKLVSVLYRLDVNESALRQLLRDNPYLDAGEIIGELIIERQLQKIKTREAFRKDNSGIDNNDKW